MDKSEPQTIGGKTLLEQIMDELERVGVVGNEIEERARNIMQGITTVESYRDVEGFLFPKYRDDGTVFKVGIPDRQKRVRCAIRCVAWYLAYQEQTRPSLLASLKKLCGFSAEQAQQWMDEYVPIYETR